MVKHDDVHFEREEASKRAAARLIMKLGSALEKLDTWTLESPDDERYIVGINIKVRYDSVGDVLAVVRADTANGPVVAFHTGTDVSSVVLGLVNRLDNGSLKWREDTPWEGSNGNS